MCHPTLPQFLTDNQDHHYPCHTIAPTVIRGQTIITMSQSSRAISGVTIPAAAIHESPSPAGLPLPEERPPPPALINSHKESQWPVTCIQESQEHGQLHYPPPDATLRAATHNIGYPLSRPPNLILRLQCRRWTHVTLCPEAPMTPNVLHVRGRSSPTNSDISKYCYILL